jgi:LytS/YehU family sensor histidine kinase
LIKIGGLIFGPIVGLFIGAATDILTVTLTAGMFHYGYFISALAYGFFSGLIKNILGLNKKKNLFVSLGISFGLMAITSIFIDLYLFNITSGENFVLSLMNIDFYLSPFFSTLILNCFCLILFLVCFF